MCQDREGELECVECLRVRWSPRKLGVLSGEMSERSNGFQEVDDKATVKVGKSDERLDLLDIGRSRPPTNGFGFSWVHCDSLWRHHKSKELDRSGMKQRLLWLDVGEVLAPCLEGMRREIHGSAQ